MKLPKVTVKKPAWHVWEPPPFIRKPKMRDADVKATRRDLFAKTMLVTALAAIASTTPPTPSYAANVLLQNAELLSNATNVSSPSGLRTEGARWSDIYNVMDYGAVPDHSTDSTAAIQACFNAVAADIVTDNRKGRKIFFPTGQYLTSYPISVTGVQGVVMEGPCSIFNGTPNSTTFQTNAMGSSSIYNMAFEGRAAAGMIQATLSNFTITPGSPVVVNWTGHGRVTGDQVVFSTTGQLPDQPNLNGVLPGFAYYVRSTGLTANSFQITGVQDINGPAIVCYGTQSGTHTVRAVRAGYTFAGSTLTVNNHQLSVGSTVQFSADDLNPMHVPSPIGTNGQVLYYVVATPTANTFQISATPTGSAITLSGGTGTQSVSAVSCAVWLGQLPTATTSGTDCQFFGLFCSGTDYGFIVGAEKVMTDGNQWTGCLFQSLPACGILITNQNCVDNACFQAGISNCGVGIQVNQGGFGLIDQCGTTSNLWDIVANTNFPCNIRAHRCEGRNVLYGPGGTFDLSGVWHSCNVFGWLVYNISGACVINNCQVNISRIHGGKGAISFGANAFDLFGVGSAANVTNVTNNGSGFCRITMSGVSGSGNQGWAGDGTEIVSIAGVTGSTGNCVNATVTAASPGGGGGGGWIDINVAFSGTYAGSGFVIPGNNAYLTAYGGSIANSYLKPNVINPALNTSPNVTLTRGLSGSSINNLGASGSITVTLPPQQNSDTGDPGVYFDFYVATAQQLEVLAQAGMKIQFGTTLGIANGNLKSSTVGSSCRIECLDGYGTGATTWIVKFATGTWTVT